MRIRKDLSNIKSVKVNDKKLINMIVRPISIRIKKLSKTIEESPIRKKFNLRPRKTIILKRKLRSNKEKFSSKQTVNYSNSTKWNPYVNLVDLNKIIDVEKCETFSAKKVFRLLNDRFGSNVK